MKEDWKTNPRNKKSLNLDLILLRNHQMNRGDFFQKSKIVKFKIKREIKSNYDSKMKLKAIQR